MTDLNCPPYTVPGWLDENGNPTSCVGDHPCPGLVAPECLAEPLPLDPITVEPVTPPDQLAETGVADMGGLALIAALLVVGGMTLIRSKLGRAS